MTSVAIEPPGRSCCEYLNNDYNQFAVKFIKIEKKSEVMTEKRPGRCSKENFGPIQPTSLQQIFLGWRMDEMSQIESFIFLSRKVARRFGNFTLRS